MTSGITMKAHATTRQAGTTPTDRRYRLPESYPTVYVVWIDGSGVLRDAVVTTTESFCAGMLVEQTGGRRDDALYELVTP